MSGGGGGGEHKQWCDNRRIFLASRLARALVYRAGPANPPVLQATIDVNEDVSRDDLSFGRYDIN